MSTHTMLHNITTDSQADMKPCSSKRIGTKLFLLPNTFVLGDNDVLCGRGSICYNHNGNQSFRSLVQSYLHQYSNALTKFQKTRIIFEIINHVRQGSPSGGFVKQDLLTGRYYELGDNLAREKISHTFRDFLCTKKHKHTLDNQQALNLTNLLEIFGSSPTRFDLEASKKYPMQQLILQQQQPKLQSVGEATESFVSISKLHPSNNLCFDHRKLHFERNNEIKDLPKSIIHDAPILEKEFYSQQNDSRCNFEICNVKSLSTMADGNATDTSNSVVSLNNISNKAKYLNNTKDEFNTSLSEEGETFNDYYNPIPVHNDNLSFINESPSLLSFASLDSSTMKSTVESEDQNDFFYEESFKFDTKISDRNSSDRNIRNSGDDIMKLPYQA